MTKLTWDQVGSRVYEAGFDRGVLYVPDGVAVPWNGLTSVEESRSNGTTTPYYLDGVKYLNTPSVNDYSAVLKAFTYPDEFLPFDGVAVVPNGLFLDSQVPQPFNLSYRSLVGNDIQGTDFGYKIHLLYNITAVPTDKTYETLGDDAKALEFSWAITGVPEMVPGYRPTVHGIIDSTKVHPYLLAELETILYGDDMTMASLPSLADITSMISEWALVHIIDNGDGTWTAWSDYDGYIVVTDDTDDTFQINQVSGVYLDPDTYTITTTT